MYFDELLSHSLLYAKKKSEAEDNKYRVSARTFPTGL